METKFIKQIQEFVEEIKNFDEDSTLKIEVFNGEAIDIYNKVLYQTDVERIILYTLAMERRFYITNENGMTYLHIF